jgi:hypothetical protein
VVGWGALWEPGGPRARRLWAASVRLLAPERCNTQLARRREAGGRLHRVLLPRTMLCAAGHLQDSCHGDSGGPLFLPGSNGEPAVLLGVVSWAPSCASTAYPTVYTAAAPFAGWIRQVSACLEGPGDWAGGCGGCGAGACDGNSSAAVAAGAAGAAAGPLGGRCAARETEECNGRCLSAADCASHGAKSCADWLADGSW